MIDALILVAALLATATTVYGAFYYQERRRRARTLATSAKRILFPFIGGALSRRALDSALRIARADGATLVPVFLARVPMRLPLDTPLPRECTAGIPLLEAIEQRAVAFGVPVDSRIERGRTHRHALREAISNERYDRLVVAAAGLPSEGFHGPDIAWLLDNAPGELVIIRPDRDDRLDAPGRPSELRSTGEHDGRHPRRPELPPRARPGTRLRRSTAGAGRATATADRQVLRPSTGRDGD